ncbi:metalloprotease [Microbotryomycetes sp. JL201]|nr:metalloprotease [Microbotryomycetes sp. JL201]
MSASLSGRKSCSFNLETLVWDRLLTLENGLRALLISDKSTDKAAAALSVNIGHLSDPDDLPGLAHYCEHMLFLGTETFPEESSYKTFLSANAGSSNAYTSLEETNYYFDVAPHALFEALDRHSAFFKCPLFEASCAEREVNAVDSEFRRNLQLDARRLFQLGKHTSSRRGTYWKFGTGSKDTLWTRPTANGEDVRSRLIEWYARHYSANLMNLVVLSSHTLEELEMVVVQNYASIPNLNLDRNVFPPALAEEQLRQMISYRTIKDTPQLRIEFPLPDLSEHWTTLPGRFLSHYLGDEGPGSVLSELKRRGWATGLDASSSGGAAGFDFFRINVSLTATGLNNFVEALKIVFAYLRLFRNTPPQEWAAEEMRKLGEISWRYKEKGQPTPLAHGLASRMATSSYAPEKLLVGPFFATEFDPDLLLKLMRDLQPSNCRVFVGSKEPLSPSEQWEEREAYYGTEYRTSPLDSKLEPEATDAKLALPRPNIFIPERLELVSHTKADHPAKRPSLVKQTGSSRLFFKKDDTWLVPRANAYFLLKTPLADETPSAAIKSQLFTTLVEEALNEYTYAATLAGVGYSVGYEPDGLQIVVSGYNDKLPVLLKVVLDKIKSFRVEDENQFKLVHDRLTRAYKNVKLSNPSGLADSHLRHLTRQTHWTFDERLEALTGLMPRDVEEHGKRLFRQLTVDGLVHGNFNRDDALEMLKLVETSLSATASGESDYHRALILPIGSNLAYRPVVPSPENVNSAAVVYYQVGTVSNHDELVRLHLFAQIAKVPVFSTLRTKEQLGYIVQSSSWTSNSVQGFRVVVQSEKTAEVLEERIEALWTDAVDKHLQEMTDDEFEKQKKSLIDRKLEKPKNLDQIVIGQKSNPAHSIFSIASEREAALVSDLAKQDIVDFFRRYIHPSSNRRAKLSILMRSQRMQPDALASLIESIGQAGLEDEAVAGLKDSLLKAKPTVAQAKAFVDQAFRDSHMPDHVRQELDRLETVPALPSDVKEIHEQEIESFRHQLELGPPVEAVGDFRTDLEAHL